MKKVLSTLLFFGLILMGSAFNTATAQNMEGDFAVGAGLVYGTGIFEDDGFDLNNDLGIQVNGYYSITPEIRIGGDFTFYFPKSQSFENFFDEIEVETSVTELNINGHYLFINESDLIVYGLAGINITRFSEKISESGFADEEFSGSETGLNLGAGLEYALDFANFYAEAKLANLGGDAGQFVLGAGLRFKF